jgi:hypothetical protein
MNKVVILKLVHMETLAVALIMLALYVLFRFLWVDSVSDKVTAWIEVLFFWFPVLAISWWIVRQFC